MFEKITPEAAGFSSEIVTEFIKKLEKRGAATHGLLFMKGDKIFAEGYWAPFHEEFCHRMYSQTKSFVGVAIGLLEEEGKLSLDDKIAGYCMCAAVAPTETVRSPLPNGQCPQAAM